jgi:hypothetical protein
MQLEARDETKGGICEYRCPGSRHPVDHRAYVPRWYVGGRRDDTQADAAPVASAREVHAEGSFEAMVFFDTLGSQARRQQQCEFMAQGRLVFSGTLDGGSSRTTTAPSTGKRDSLKLLSA